MECADIFLVSLIGVDDEPVRIGSVMNLCIPDGHQFELPAWVSHVAMDKDEMWFAYSYKPDTRDDVDEWMIFGKQDNYHKGYIGSANPLNLDWRHSCFIVRMMDMRDIERDDGVEDRLSPHPDMRFAPKGAK